MGATRKRTLRDMPRNQMAWCDVCGLICGTLERPWSPRWVGENQKIVCPDCRNMPLLVPPQCQSRLPASPPAPPRPPIREAAPAAPYPTPPPRRPVPAPAPKPPFDGQEGTRFCETCFEQYGESESPWVYRHATNGREEKVCKGCGTVHLSLGRAQ